MEIKRKKLSLNKAISNEKIPKIFGENIKSREIQGGKIHSIKPMSINFEKMLMLYGIEIKYNEITKEPDIFVGGMEQEGSLDNKGLKEQVLIKDLHLLNNIVCTDSAIDLNIKAMAAKNKYNPVLEYIDKIEHDESKNMLKVLINSIELNHSTPESENLKKVYLKNWLLCALGMLHNYTTDKYKGFFYEGILVFQGSEEAGKSSFIRMITPSKLIDYVKEGFVMDVTNKDKIFEFSTYWLVEMGEMDSSLKNKKDHAEFKNFVTRRTDEARYPYGKKSVVLPRRTSAFGTLNPDDLMTDDLGSRRFWILSVKKISLPSDFDAEQLWAQINQLLKVSRFGEKRADHKIVLPWIIEDTEVKEMRKQANMNQMEFNSIEDRIVALFGEAQEVAGENCKWLCTPTSMVDFLGLRKEEGNIAAKVGKTLKKLYGTQIRGYVGNKQVRWYALPKRTRKRHVEAPEQYFSAPTESDDIIWKLEEKRVNKEIKLEQRKH